MSLLQKILTISVLAGLFLYILSKVDPVDLFEWGEVVLFYAAAVFAILLMLNWVFKIPVGDVIPRLSNLEGSTLFPHRGSAPAGGGESGEHYILQRRNRGSCQKLEGDVVVTFLLVDDPDGSWSEEDTERFMAQQNAGTVFLEQEAARYGVDLSIRLKYVNCVVNKTFVRGADEDWRNAALKAAGLPKAKKAADYLMELYGADQTPVMLCVPRTGRAYASQADGFEYGVLFDVEGDYAHELCHNFGTADYYYPDEIRSVAQEIYPNSIMLTSDNRTIDSLSAYQMGWMEEPDADARAFLDATGWVTLEFLGEAHEKNTFTGVGTVSKEYYTYQGDLVAGVPDGTGSFAYTNGNTYSGEVSYGRPQGQGTMNWSDGSSYSGMWENGEATGYGVLYYNDGYVYRGEVVNCIRQGWGTMENPNGDVYVGSWEQGKRHGEGTYTWASGYQQSGWWNMGEFVG